MAESNCPVCYTALEAREVAPCWDCGADPRELDHLRSGQHTYDEVEMLGAPIVLCNFCQVDFTSYDPTYFGRPLGRSLGLPTNLIRPVRKPRVEHDKVCPQCKRRLAFLRYVIQVRGAPAT
jgi:ribosomal protein L37AE/L43A